jgi:hypothetical protein
MEQTFGSPIGCFDQANCCLLHASLFWLDTSESATRRLPATVQVAWTDPSDLLWGYHWTIPRLQGGQGRVFSPEGGALTKARIPPWPSAKPRREKRGMAGLAERNTNFCLRPTR